MVVDVRGKVDRLSQRSGSRSLTSRGVEVTEVLWGKRGCEQRFHSHEETAMSRVVQMVQSEMRQKEQRNWITTSPMSWGSILKPGEDTKVPEEECNPNRDSASYALGPGV